MVEVVMMKSGPLGRVAGLVEISQGILKSSWRSYPFCKHRWG